MLMPACACGCGRMIKQGRKYVSGHSGRNEYEPTPEEIEAACLVLRAKHLARRRAEKPKDSRPTSSKRKRSGRV